VRELGGLIFAYMGPDQTSLHCLDIRRSPLAAVKDIEPIRYYDTIGSTY
jgi:hypothetical protein